MANRAMDQGAYRGSGTPQGNGAQESMSVIDQYSNFDGTYNSTRDLRIEGQAKGTIECRGTLFIAQGANVDARVEAENIAVAGELEGEISCRGRLQLLPTGRVRGKIHTQTLVIHEGAFYEGDLEMAGREDRTGRSRRTERERSESVPVRARQTEQDDEAGEQPLSGQERNPSVPNTFIRRFGGQEQQWDTQRGPEPEITDD